MPIIERFYCQMYVPHTQFLMTLASSVEPAETVSLSCGHEWSFNSVSPTGYLR